MIGKRIVLCCRSEADDGCGCCFRSACAHTTPSPLPFRDQEIQHIARSIEELSQIFKELAVLVIDQGTVLDRIDFNMEQVVGACVVVICSVNQLAWRGGCN